MSPQISVIMPCYNAENYIRESINSILNQTFRDFEFIIINDGSEDDTPEIIESYDDPRLKIDHQSNHGLPFTLNKGLELAKGEFIARMDADDIAMKERFERQVEFLRDEKDVVLVGSNAIKIDKDGNYVYETDCPTTWEDIKSQFPHPQIIHPSILFRSLAAQESGGYPDIPMGEDIIFYNYISEYGKLINLSQPLIKYRIHPSAFSRKNKEVKDLTKQMFKEFGQSGEINKMKVEKIKKYRSLESKGDKRYDYHILLAKKFLWNNYNSKQARFHLREAFRKGNKSNSIEIGILFLLSFLGQKVLLNTYRLVKGFKRII